MSDAGRSPDLMDRDVDLIKSLEETRKNMQDCVEPDTIPTVLDASTLVPIISDSINDIISPDDNEPGPSSRRLTMSAGTVLATPKKEGHPGRFMWIWLLGIKLPALIVDGEPHLPIEVIDELLNRQNALDAEAFHTLLLRTNTYIRIATHKQYNMYHEKSDICQQKNFPTISMMGRSDIERIMGEVRRESWPTKAEHDVWDEADRVHVVHVNFIDLCETWLQDDEDIEEDMMEDGTHGYWYKSRVNMRCIECRECKAYFTPTDFILHHHYEVPPHGMVHHGLTSSNWHQMIEIHKEDKTPENQAAWQKFVMNAHRIGKRNYAEAEPQEPKIAKMELDVVEEMEVDEEDVIDNEEPLIRKHPIPPKWVDREYEKMEVQLCDHWREVDPSEYKPKNRLELLVGNHMNALSRDDLEKMFNTSPEDFLTWLRDMDFQQKVLEQQQLWNQIRQDPAFRRTDSANFNPTTGEFQNLRVLETASKSVREEIGDLAKELIRVDKSCTGWQRIQKEHKLLQGLSEEATRVLDNKPLDILKQQPPTILKPVPITISSIPTIPPMAMMNQMAQLAQTFVAQHPIPFGSIPVTLTPATTCSGKSVKSVTPVKSPRVSAPLVLPKVITPITPMTPMTPITPLSPPNVELLKHQISMAMANPQLFPIFYPKIPTNAYEQLSQLFKTTAVQN